MARQGGSGWRARPADASFARAKPWFETRAPGSCSDTQGLHSLAALTTASGFPIEVELENRPMSNRSIDPLPAAGRSDRRVHGGGRVETK
jgi:hypothetical protein